MSLGCAEEYTVSLTNRCGTAVKCQVDSHNISLMTWFRILDQPGQCQVRVPCPCDCWTEAESWLNSVVVHRDGELVWGPGPVIQRKRDADGVTVIAWDVSAWLLRRFPHDNMVFDDDTDISLIAERLIKSGMRPDDPCGATIQRLDSKTRGTHSYRADSGYVSDHIKELTDSGLHWTVIGNAYRLFGVAGTGQVTSTLTDDDFVNLGLDQGASEVQSGFDMFTRVRVSNNATDINVLGVCGTTDPFYGLLEKQIDSDSVRSNAAALRAACAVTTVFPPVELNVPPSSQLSPDAQVDLGDLIPGVLFPVSMELGCGVVNRVLMLDQVTVTWGSQEGEKVGIDLVTPTSGRRAPRTLAEVLADLTSRYRQLRAKVG